MKFGTFTEDYLIYEKHALICWSYSSV